MPQRRKAIQKRSADNNWESLNNVFPGDIELVTCVESIPEKITSSFLLEEPGPNTTWGMALMICRSYSQIFVSS